MILYKNKYRIKSLRLTNWDYSNFGYYYITICTEEKEEYFGKIENGKMILNELGKIAYNEWLKIKEIRNGVDLDEFIIMPNHLHGIIVITNDHFNINDINNNDENNNNVETLGHASLQLPQIKQNLSNIIRGFKGSVTNKIRTSINKQFAWQTRFYEHIIRNEKSLYEIHKYIKLNSLKWEIDKENSNKN
ncbi:MAG: transposase [Melioribacteraceae bacterium]